MDAGFISTNVHLLEDRFSLSYTRDASCIEYFLDSRERHELVSENLILSWDTRKNGLYVSKFYPRLYLEEASRYLSAACFYLIIFHAVHEFRLRDRCTVWLETDINVFNAFYAKLKEFQFRISRPRIGGKVCLTGVFQDLPIHPHGIDPVRDPFAWL